MSMTLPVGIASAPWRFCGVGRKTAKRVPGSTREVFDELTTQNRPAPWGCARVGDRVVAPLDRFTRIALRAAPGGSPHLRATQTVPTGRVML